MDGVTFVFGVGEMAKDTVSPGLAAVAGLGLPLGMPPRVFVNPGIFGVTGFEIPTFTLPGFSGLPILTIGVPFKVPRKGFPLPSVQFFFMPWTFEYRDLFCFIDVVFGLKCLCKKGLVSLTSAILEYPALVALPIFECGFSG